jgi:8-oxo-dGTP pyrophosphatase MutT (NUDIX family)
MDSDETPAQAALSEVDEECMIDAALVLARDMYTYEHGSPRPGRRCARRCCG